MRLANLNVFIPSFILAELILSQILMFPIILIFGLLSHLVAVDLAKLFLLPHILTFLVVVVLFLKFDFSPKIRKPEREGRYRKGHWVLGIMNAIAIIAILIPIILSKLNHSSDMMLLMWFVIPVIGVGLLVWATGLYMVWSSRAFDKPSRNL